VPQILVVSHNIARGGTGSAKTLFARYARLERKLRRPIDVLCLQEQQTFDGKNLADEICRMLNGDYAVHVDSVPRTSSLPPFPDPAVIWNTRTLRRIATLLKPIPRLECYSRRAQMFATDEAQQRLVAGVRFRDASGSLLDVWSVHLDAWGGNAHKAQQLLSVVTPPESQYGIPPAPLPERKIICGDTNIYAPCHLPSRRLRAPADSGPRRNSGSRIAADVLLSEAPWFGYADETAPNAWAYAHACAIEIRCGCDEHAGHSIRCRKSV